jgi:shikimate dehydrogenase
VSARAAPTSLYLIGHPVGHSLSPRMQGAALRAAGIDATYEALDVLPGALDDALASLRDRNAAGNITIPHKQAVADRCARLSAAARAAGAVNAFWFEGGVLVGDNTDIAGFDAAARALCGDAWPPRNVAMLGAGGAAAAVAIGVGGWPGSTLTVWARRAEQASAFAQRFDDVRAAATAREAIRDADLVVNATPVGLHDDTLPLDVAALAPGAAVLDLVYRPGETALARAARAAGHRASDGMAMLVEQGAAAFARWFGTEPDRRVMWRALGREAPSQKP